MPEAVHDPLVERLAVRIHETLAEALGHHGGVPAALVNFPNHANAGDSAIWLGEEAALSRLGTPVAVRVSPQAWNPGVVQSAVREGPVLVNGGGNFGDVYMNQQSVRESLLGALRANPVVQLPQSMWFRDPASVERVRRIVEGHGDVKLMWRDQQSLEMAREHFDVPSLLCPDMAFALGSLARPAAPRVPVLWVARRDPEASGYAPPSDPRIEVLDWLEPVPGERPPPVRARLAFAANRALTPFSQSPSAAVASAALSLLGRTYSPLARHWLGRGCSLLSRGQVVVTDRLHGHILATLMGQPHVLVECKSGKLGAFHRTWTSESPLAIWAASPTEAAEVALALAADPPPGC